MPRANLRPYDLPRWLHYVLAVVMPVIAGLLRAQFEVSFGQGPPFVFFLIADAFVAYVGGLYPGLVAMVISGSSGVYFFLNKRSFLITGTKDWIAFSSFVIVSVTFSVICELLQQTGNRYRAVAVERDIYLEDLNSILNSISDSFFAIDNEWNVTHTNASFQKLIGKQEHDMQGQPLNDFFPIMAPQTLIEQLRQTKLTNQILITEFPEQEGDRWFQLRAFPNPDGLFVYIQDVTTQHLLQLERESLLANERKARSDAEHASRMKDEFVATLSHELRTPLTAILGWSEILQRRSKGNEQFEEGLAAIEKSTRLQAQLIDDLLEVSRIITGKLRLHIELVELNEILRQEIETFRQPAENKHIRLQYTGSGDDIYLRGDANRLSQVINNLLSNAVKFSGLESKIDVKAEQQGPWAVISVTDYGEGIDPAFLPHVFERFRQANASISRKQGGLGLGLSIVHQLVELHGGSVEASSPGKGSGSTFTVKLPVAMVPRLKHTIGSEEDVLGEMPLTGKRIFIVEDDDPTRNLIALMLSEAGAEVQAANSVDAALEGIEGFNPDLLISDIGMPEKDGYQLIREIRHLSNDRINKVPAIALTAFARAEDQQMALTSGYNAHLSKPIHTKALIKEAVDRIAAKK